MERLFLAAALLGTALATPATAQSSITGNFDNEGGGASALNYTNFGQFDVTRGSVDLIHQPDYGLTCAGGSGSCIDLDGTTNSGGALTTKNAIAFATGSLVTLSFDLSGNQRGAGSDLFTAGFIFGNQTSLLNYTLGGGFGGFSIGSFNATGITTGGSIFDTTPFTRYTLSFTAGGAGTAKGFVGTSSNDNFGPILDNFSLSATAVPEPATWAMMMLGFGIVGFGVRSRRAGAVTTKVAFG